MTKKNILDSKSFAVVGASRDENKIGHIIFKNLVLNKIKAFPVNPNADKILDIKCYKSLLEVEKTDCVIITVPAKIVPSVLKDVVKKKVKDVVVISSGFSEIGNEELNREVKEICERNKINLLGPNSMGFINSYNRVNTTFDESRMEKGNIAFISQSGAIGSAILDKNIKLSCFVSIGNSLILDFSYFLEYFSEDKNTEVIALYIESIGEKRGKKFIEACKKCKKPIIALKAGKTEKGNKIARSHTASLASKEGIYEGVFNQCNIIEVDSIKELFAVAELYSKITKLGKRACVITNAGGPGVLCADYCVKNKIELSDLPTHVVKKLDEILPSGWSRNNPVDILGDANAELYSKTINVLKNESFFDFFIILLTPQYMTEPYKTSEVIIGIKEKPVFACFIGGEKIRLSFSNLKEKAFVFEDPKEMCEALGKIVK